MWSEGQDSQICIVISLPLSHSAATLDAMYEGGNILQLYSLRIFVQKHMYWTCMNEKFCVKIIFQILLLIQELVKKKRVKVSHFIIDLHSQVLFWALFHSGLCLLFSKMSGLRFVSKLPTGTTFYDLDASGHQLSIATLWARGASTNDPHVNPEPRALRTVSKHSGAVWTPSNVVLVKSAFISSSLTLSFLKAIHINWIIG